MYYVRVNGFKEKQFVWIKIFFFISWCEIRLLNPLETDDCCSNFHCKTIIFSNVKNLDSYSLFRFWSEFFVTTIIHFENWFRIAMDFSMFVVDHSHTASCNDIVGSVICSWLIYRNAWTFLLEILNWIYC